MKKNEGTADRIIRAVLGVVALVAGYIVSPWFYIVAALALITAATGFCGLYKLIGVTTCPVKKGNSPVDEQTPQS
jgi:hypothetical protein